MRKGVLLEEEHRIMVTPEAAERRRYVYLPVDVPAFAAELYVAYEVRGHGSVDIGVFEPSEAEIPPISAFRGWSGSARSEFCISRNHATPGYLAGVVVPGRWRIVLGLYVIQEECEVIVSVRVTRRRVRCGGGERNLASDLMEARREALDVPGICELAGGNPLEEEGWLRGDLHCHTEHSNDADHPISVATAVAIAEALGLDFLAITDHNTTSHWQEIKAIADLTPVELICAEEVTTYRGHFNAFSPPGVLDFRTDSDSKIETIIAGAARRNALLSINHPKRVGPPWEYSIPKEIVAIEAWQAQWFWMNWESMGLWSRLLDEGRRLTAIGGSDIHDLYVRPGHTMGIPTTWVFPDGEGIEGILHGIRKGTCLISESPSSALLTLDFLTESGQWLPAPGRAVEPDQPLRIRLFGDFSALSVCITWSAAEKEWLSHDGNEIVEIEPMPGNRQWQRAELWALGEKCEADPGRRLVAVTNPIYSTTVR